MKNNNLKKKLDKKLTTLILEIDITKSEKSITNIIEMLQQLENGELADNDLTIKDLYFK